MVPLVVRHTRSVGPSKRKAAREGTAVPAGRLLGPRCRFHRRCSGRRGDLGRCSGACALERGGGSAAPQNRWFRCPTTGVAYGAVRREICATCENTRNLGPSVKGFGKLPTFRFSARFSGSDLVKRPILRLRFLNWEDRLISNLDRFRTKTISNPGRVSTRKFTVARLDDSDFRVREHRVAAFDRPRIIDGLLNPKFIWSHPIFSRCF